MVTFFDFREFPSLASFKFQQLQESGDERLAIFGSLHDVSFTGEISNSQTSRGWTRAACNFWITARQISLGKNREHSTFQSWSILGPALQTGNKDYEF